MIPGGALEQALWLHDAPARRDAVRGAPLPADIEAALSVAGGSPAAVAEAAAATGAAPGIVLEAVRFYLQQVLFAEGANAYRVLGVARSASTEQIRRHHKLLQAWLHPDRNADAWNDVFAARVNHAWAALRSDSARARYDAAPAPAREPGLPPRPTAVAHHWEPLEPPGTRSRARWLALAAFASCVVLLGMLLFREPHVVPSATRAEVAVAQPARAAGEGRGPLPHAVALAPGDVPPAAVPSGAEVGVPTIATHVAHAGEPVSAQASHPVAPAPAPAARALRNQDEPAPARPARVAVAEPQPQPPRSAAVPEPAPQPPADPPPAVPTTVAVASPARPPTDPYQRMQEAQASLRTALAFLSDADAAPPLWNDVRAAALGMRAREALHARARVGRFAVAGSHWVLRDDAATFGARYDTGGRRGERGRLDLLLVRRENRWLVADLRLEPAG